MDIISNECVLGSLIKGGWGEGGHHYHVSLSLIFQPVHGPSDKGPPPGSESVHGEVVLIVIYNEIS